MATLLTDSQVLSVFQLLEVPWNNNAAAGAQPGFYTMDPMGTLGAQTLLSNTTQQAAQTQILTYLDNLHTNRVALETELITLVTRFQTIGTTTARVEGGSIGSLSGVSYDYEKERAFICNRVKIIVPFYKYHEILARRSGDMGVNGIKGGGGVMISVTR